mmetsp:Transcript_7931/g.10396  ORF Transcript_7931/g.10396 Transcript_7931/m.10396 type:complete len:133 (-) Transcript_7931:24-422(-)
MAYEKWQNDRNARRIFSGSVTTTTHCSSSSESVGIHSQKRPLNGGQDLVASERIRKKDEYSCFQLVKSFCHLLGRLALLQQWQQSSSSSGSCSSSASSMPLEWVYSYAPNTANNFWSSPGNTGRINSYNKRR